MNWYERYGKLLVTGFLGFLVAALLWHLAHVSRALNHDLTTHPSGVEAAYAYLKSEREVSPDAIDQQTFTPSSWNDIPLDFADQVYWLRLKLSNGLPEARSLILIMDNPMIDRLEVFRRVEGGTLERILLTGDEVDSEVFAHALPHVRVHLPAAGEQTLYVRAQTDGAPILPLSLMTAETFVDYERSLHLLWGAFVGTVLLMTIYNLLLFIGLRDTTYLYYIGYVLSLMTLLGVAHGYGYYLFPLELQQWLSKQIISLNTVGTLMTLLFGVSFLKYSTRQGPLAKTIRVFCWALILFLGVTLVIPEYVSAPLYGPFQILTYTLAITLIVRRLPDRHSWTRFYIASWVPLAASGAVAYLLFSGYIEYSFYSRHFFPVSVTLEMALASMALADRFSAIRKDRLYQATHDEALGMANEALLIQAIEREHAGTQRASLALIAAEITNFESIRPYLSQTELRRLMTGLSRRFCRDINDLHPLMLIDAEKAPDPYSAVMRGEILGFLIRAEDEAVLSGLLAKLSDSDNYNPLPQELPFRIHCHLAAATMQPEDTPGDLIVDVRQALQEAKAKQPAFHVYKRRQESDPSAQIRLAQDLVNAIERDELELHHQPQLNLDAPDTCASELLIRWNHPTRGWVPALDLVTIAEETGLIRSLTRWIVRDAFRRSAALRDAGHADHLLSINISGNDMSRVGFAEEVIEELDAAALPSHHFILEVTESASLSDQESFLRNFQALTDKGFRFAIDDFGTGYSSLSYAHQLPFSELKIDGSFITGVTHDARRQTIVSATVSMAQQLRLSITAEGVEDAETAEYLKALGCDRLQGYWIARPMAFEQYLAWLADAQASTDKGLG